MLLPFFYHTVSDEDLPHCKHLFPVKTVKQFEADLEYLLKNYEPLELDDLPNWKQLKKPKFLLTFDDGMREVGEIIAPILLKKGVPAIFFVNRDFAERNAIFYKHQISFLKEELIKKNKLSSSIEQIINTLTIHNQKKINEHFNSFVIDDNKLKISNLYLSKKELSNLKSNGFLIGSHSLNHPYFGDIAEPEQLNQITESMNWIVQNFNPSIRTFAFPFEDYFLKKSFFEKLNQSPFAPEFTFGTSKGKTDEITNSIQRIDAEKNGWHIEKIIKNYQRKKLVRKLIGRDKIRR